MINLNLYKDKHVGVLGLGKTGKAAVDALKTAGAIVSVYDDKIENDLATIQSLDTLVVSPGIHLLWPVVHPIVKLAHRYSVPVVGDLDLFQQHVNTKNICITGTNGKSTTTSLIGHVLQSVASTSVGGNIGQPILSLPNDSEFYVFELSSYQLEVSSILGFDISILLNITPDHLTRHGGMDGYISAKQKIFANFNTNSTAIIGVDDEHCRKIYTFLRDISHPCMIPISGYTVPEFGIGWDNDCLIDNRLGNHRFIRERKESLAGNHNYQNIAATYAACSVSGVSDTLFCELLDSFNGLSHRQELIAEINGIQYVNDSKATNADSVEQALKRFDNIVWILGGRPKEDGIESLVKYFHKIHFACLIGEAANEWSKLLTRNGVENRIARTLDVAIEIARIKAAELNAKVVLLSPACASFDQFKSFEDRGNEFRRLVMAIKGMDNG